MTSQSQLDGNESQNRIIARQMFAAWSEEQEARRTKLSGSLPAWIACVLSLLGLAWSAAVISSDVSENRRRIEALEIKQDKTATDSTQVLDRLARIEAKLDIMGNPR